MIKVIERETFLIIEKVMYEWTKYINKMENYQSMLSRYSISYLYHMIKIHFYDILVKPESNSI